MLGPCSHFSRSALAMAGLVISVVLLARTCEAQLREAQLPTRTYALLIGINRYDPPLTELKFAKNDMEALQKKLIEIGVAQDNITFLRDGAGEAYYPTRSKIITALDLTLSAAQENDRVIVAFAGHGVLEGGVSFLCPVDGHPKHTDDTCISLDRIIQELKECRASQKIVLIDACRNELVLRGVRSFSVRGGIDRNLVIPKGIKIMCSCDEKQYAVEDDDLQHGVFMHYVIEGLSGRADLEAEGNRDGIVTFPELYAYVYEKTEAHARQKFHLTQQPWKEGASVGVWQLARVTSSAAEKPTPVVPPPVPTDPVEQLQQLVTPGEFERLIELAQEEADKLDVFDRTKRNNDRLALDHAQRRLSAYTEQLTKRYGKPFEDAWRRILEFLGQQNE